MAQQPRATAAPWTPPYAMQQQQQQQQHQPPMQPGYGSGPRPQGPQQQMWGQPPQQQPQQQRMPQAPGNGGVAGERLYRPDGTEFPKPGGPPSYTKSMQGQMQQQPQMPMGAMPWMPHGVQPGMPPGAKAPPMRPQVPTQPGTPPSAPVNKVVMVTKPQAVEAKPVANVVVRQGSRQYTIPVMKSPVLKGNVLCPKEEIDGAIFGIDGIIVPPNPYVLGQAAEQAPPSQPQAPNHNQVAKAPVPGTTPPSMPPAAPAQAKAPASPPASKLQISPAPQETAAAPPTPKAEAAAEGSNDEVSSSSGRKIIKDIKDLPVGCSLVVEVNEKGERVLVAVPKNES